jgi:PAS domain-containing protein
MTERRTEQRLRTLRSGKIFFNGRRSVIDCVVRNLSTGGTCLRVDNTLGIPPTFDLLLDGDSSTRSCRAVWVSDNRLGVEFCDAGAGTNNTVGAADAPDPDPLAAPVRGEEQAAPIYVRSELISLRTALDNVPVGIVLLDSETRAQFINRAFRQMWRLTDAKAESKPPFVALVYHGRDTHAYAVPSGDLDAYVAMRVAHVKPAIRSRSTSACSAARSSACTVRACRMAAACSATHTSPTSSVMPTSSKCFARRWMKSSKGSPCSTRCSTRSS